MTPRAATNDPAYRLQQTCERSAAEVLVWFLFDRSLAKDFAGKIMDARTSHAETSCCQEPLIVGGP
jgi:hypothetical protein